MKNVTPQAALPPGAAAGATDPLKPATVDPWTLYDEFLEGRPLAEIARTNATTEASVQADVDQMRAWIRLRLPHLTDAECDAYRRCTLQVERARIASTSDPSSAPALRLLSEAHEKQEAIERTSAARVEREIF